MLPNKRGKHPTPSHTQRGKTLIINNRFNKLIHVTTFELVLDWYETKTKKFEFKQIERKRERKKCIKMVWKRGASDGKKISKGN